MRKEENEQKGWLEAAIAAKKYYLKNLISMDICFDMGYLGRLVVAEHPPATLLPLPLIVACESFFVRPPGTRVVNEVHVNLFSFNRT